MTSWICAFEFNCQAGKRSRFLTGRILASGFHRFIADGRAAQLDATDWLAFLWVEKSLRPCGQGSLVAGVAKTESTDNFLTKTGLRCRPPGPTA
jgi:hypothetical protein